MSHSPQDVDSAVPRDNETDACNVQHKVRNGHVAEQNQMHDEHASIFESQSGGLLDGAEGNEDTDQHWVLPESKLNLSADDDSAGHLNGDAEQGFTTTQDTGNGQPRMGADELFYYPSLLMEDFGSAESLSFDAPAQIPVAGELASLDALEMDGYHRFLASSNDEIASIEMHNTTSGTAEHPNGRVAEQSSHSNAQPQQEAEAVSMAEHTPAQGAAGSSRPSSGEDDHEQCDSPRDGAVALDSAVLQGYCPYYQPLRVNGVQAASLLTGQTCYASSLGADQMDIPPHQFASELATNHDTSASLFDHGFPCSTDSSLQAGMGTASFCHHHHLTGAHTDQYNGVPTTPPPALNSGSAHPSLDDLPSPPVLIEDDTARDTRTSDTEAIMRRQSHSAQALLPSAGAPQAEDLQAAQLHSRMGKKEVKSANADIPTKDKSAADGWSGHQQHVIISPTTGREMKLGPGFMEKVAELPSAVQALFSDISSKHPKRPWTPRTPKSKHSMMPARQASSGKLAAGGKLTSRQRQLLAKRCSM